MSETPRPVLPPTYFMVALVIECGLHFGAPGLQWIEAPWRYVGALPILAGVAVSIHGSNLFEHHGTTIKPFQEPSALVIVGAFRYSRNPMYLGMVAILAGTAIGLGSATPWLIVIAFVPIITSRFIVPEEKSLSRAFGKQYDDYRRAVRRWI